MWGSLVACLVLTAALCSIPSRGLARFSGSGRRFVTAAPKPDTQAIEQALAYLYPDLGGAVVLELRGLGVGTGKGGNWKQNRYGYFDAAAPLASAAARMNAQGGAVYVTLNPVHPDLFSRSGNATRKADKGDGAQDIHIPHRRWLPVDCDPVRPSKISATDDELGRALACAEAIRAHLTDRGWPEPLYAMSGNGSHLLYRIDLPGDDGGLVRRCVNALADSFSTQAVDVDRKVYNASRLWKLYGTVANKGTHTPGVPGRPGRLHRLARIMQAPSSPVTVPRALLEELAAESEDEPQALRVVAPQALPPGTTHTVLSGGGLVSILDAAGVPHGEPEPYQGGCRISLESCPLCGSGDGKQVAGALANGAMWYRCPHENTCPVGSRKGAWKVYRAAIDPQGNTRKKKGKGYGASNSQKQRGVVDTLEAWRIINKQLINVKEVDTNGNPHGELVFDGVPQVQTINTRWFEGAIDAWESESENRYEVKLGDGRTERFTLLDDQVEFMRRMNREPFLPFTRCVTPADRTRLHIWTHANSNPTRLETRRWIGLAPGTFGWLSPPQISVARGEVNETAYAVGPPQGEGGAYNRYGLKKLPPVRLLEVARFVLEDMLGSDHSDGALAVRMLGEMLCGPLYSMVPMLQSWQRAAGFIQGPSGVGKSQVARYWMSMWGSFLPPEGLPTWRSTDAYIEDVLHRVIGAPVFVSDWKHSNMPGNAMTKAQGLLQAYADRSARGRCTSGAVTKKPKPPRCHLVIDGENLPSNEQSTLGRLVVIKVQGDPARDGLCATAHEGVLADDLVADMPGLTAEWVAWVQRELPWIEAELRRSVDALGAIMPHGSTNRSRLLRSYAVRIVSVRGWCRMLESLGIGGVLAGVDPISVSANADGCEIQLGLVHRESVAEQFMGRLQTLLWSGEVRLESVNGCLVNPFEGSGDLKPCVGLVDDMHLYLWPDAVMGRVQADACRGGGDRISANRGEVLQMLQQDGYVKKGVGSERKYAFCDGQRRVRARAWKIERSAVGTPIDSLGLGLAEADDAQA